MTENKRFVMRYGKYIDTVENIEYDEKWESWKIVELLNTLSDENEQLEKILYELSDMLQFDVENGIRSYPVKLSEYLSDALKELQE